MLAFIFIAFLLLTVWLFIAAFTKKPPEPPRPPDRGASLLIQWSVNSPNNVSSQGQVLLDEANLRQLPPGKPVKLGNQNTYQGPALGTVMAETRISYNELFFDAAPPKNPLRKADIGGWIVAISMNEKPLKGADAFQLVHSSVSTPHRLFRIYAR